MKGLFNILRMSSYHEFNYCFMDKHRRTVWAAISTSLILISIGSFLMKGMVLGIDFTGGTLLEVQYSQGADLNKIRDTLQNGGYKDAMVQYFGSSHDVLIRLGLREEKNSQMISHEILKLLTTDQNQVMMRRVEFVGPQVGKDLIEGGLWAMLYTTIGILIYVAVRFEKRFAASAIIAMLHDPIIIIGIFSLFGLEFDLTVLAAILAIVGYSLNDTIVVFDRIRDNLLKMRKETTEEVMNVSINQTLVRTIMTSWSTLVTVLALFFVGGDLIHGFALALIIGIVVGTYSSIYVASAAALWMGVKRADLMPVTSKENALDRHS
jgi:preprotein translocase subunit SecF